jgi:hypothetical protein
MGEDGGKINTPCLDVINLDQDQNTGSIPHTHMCLFMSMLYNKIRFEIDINKNELLKTVHKEVNKGREPRKILLN